MAATQAVLTHNDLTPQILSHLCDKALARACQVCQLWRQTGTTSVMWRPRCIKTYPELKGLLVPDADCHALYVRHALSRLTPLASPPVAALERDGLSFVARIERRGKLNGKAVYRTVCAATLPGNLPTHERDTSFSWPNLPLKERELSQASGFDEVMESAEPSLEEIVGTLQEHGKLVVSLGVHRASDGKVCSLMVRSPVNDIDENDSLPGAPDYFALYFAPSTNTDLDLAVVVRLKAHWGSVQYMYDTDDTDPVRAGNTPLVWSLGVAFARLSKMEDSDMSDDDSFSMQYSDEQAGAQAQTPHRALTEIARLNWT